MIQKIDSEQLIIYPLLLAE